MNQEIRTGRPQREKASILAPCSGMAEATPSGTVRGRDAGATVFFHSFGKVCRCKTDVRDDVRDLKHLEKEEDLNASQDSRNNE